MAAVRGGACQPRLRQHASGYETNNSLGITSGALSGSSGSLAGLASYLDSRGMNPREPPRQSAVRRRFGVPLDALGTHTQLERLQRSGATTWGKQPLTRA